MFKSRTGKGFTLVELTVFMTATAVLMAAIAAVETVSRQSTFTEMASLRLLEDGRSVSSYLRSDLASAESVRIAEGGARLEVDTGEGGRVVYALEEGGKLVRSFAREEGMRRVVMRGRVEEFSAMADPSFPQLVRVKVKLSRSTGVRDLTLEPMIVVTTRRMRDKT